MKSTIKDASSYKVLDDHIWKTKHCRHLAASRLKRKNTYSQYTITILSIYVLALSIGPKFNYFTQIPADQISFINILLSVAIIALSLLESNNNYQVQAERLYHCANELARLLVKLNHVADYSLEAEKDIREISCQYDDIIQKYNENHSGMDYEVFVASNDTKIFYKKILYKYICAKYFLWSFGMYICLVLLPVLYYVFVYKGLYLWLLVKAGIVI